jgi:hypothetical protein
LDKVGDSALSVGAGNTKNAQACCWVAGERVGDEPRRGARVGRAQVGQAAEFRKTVPAADYGDGAGRGRLGGEIMAVGVGAGRGDKHRARTDAARVLGNRGRGEGNAAGAGNPEQVT